MGDICSCNYFINSGLVRSFTLDEDGKDYTWGIHFNDENAKMYHLFVIDYESFIKQTPSALSYEVLEDCELVSMKYKNVQFLYGYFKKGEHFGRIMAECAYKRVHSVLLERIRLSEKQTLENFMKTTPFLMDKISQYHIASYLGMRAQTLSKLKKELIVNLDE
jgi:CRP-like cAMP-binding protein